MHVYLPISKVGSSLKWVNRRQVVVDSSKADRKSTTHSFNRCFLHLFSRERARSPAAHKFACIQLTQLIAGNWKSPNARLITCSPRCIQLLSILSSTFHHSFVSLIHPPFIGLTFQGFDLAPKRDAWLLRASFDIAQAGLPGGNFSAFVSRPNYIHCQNIGGENSNFGAIDRSQLTLLALFDVSAAFDTAVDHEILLERLQISFGVTSAFLCWLRSLLGERSFCVVHGSTRSPWVPAPYGLPQGSVLGPLLYLTYTSDLATLLASYSALAQLYADDVQAYLHCSASDAIAITQVVTFIMPLSPWGLDIL